MKLKVNDKEKYHKKAKCVRGLGIPYSGCNASSSSIYMDKHLSKRLMRAVGIPTADWVTVESKEQRKS